MMQAANALASQPPLAMVIFAGVAFLFGISAAVAPYVITPIEQ